MWPTGRQDRPAGRCSFAQRLQDAVAHLSDDHDVVTTLSMVGPMTVVSDELAGHAEAVVVEVLSNAVWRSGVANITVEVSVSDERLIEITGDGRGIPRTTSAELAWPILPNALKTSAATA